jgi:hypothetical protein
VFPARISGAGEDGDAAMTDLTKNPETQQSGSLAMIEAIGDSAPAKLQIFEEARREIAEAKTVDQVKHILAMATGLAAAAHKATDTEMEAEAAALRFEAERRLGQLMQVQKEMIGLSRGGRPKTGFSKNPVSDQPGTLAEAGIDKNLAHRARKAADMSEAEAKEVAEALRAAAPPRRKKPKAKRSAVSQDMGLKFFTEHVVALRRFTKKCAPERFTATAIAADDLDTLAKFLADLAGLKRREAAE